MSTVDLIDLGLFGLGEKGSSSSGLVEDVEMYHSEELDNLFTSHPAVENILDVSLQQSGIAEETTVESEKTMLPPSWEDDTDEFLKSMLTGSDLSGLGVSGSDTVCPSDTSSDSGCPEEQVRTLTSPGLDDGPCYTTAYTPLPSPLPSPANSLADLYLDDSDDQGPHEAVSPLDTVCDPLDQTATGTTTIILPVVPNGNRGPQQVTVTPLILPSRELGPPIKKRRVSNSSSDSGLEETSYRQHPDNKYPPLHLNDEEQKMAMKEGMKFPSHYPLTREEERNLKKIRRKIRNKLSAQDSRKRKREYVDSMEDRVKHVSDENAELKEKINALETQNKTLAAQLRRLHQIVVNGGLRQGQTSTALMVLLLSTALFLIPGLGDKADSKNEIDIQSALKMPPMPGQSRSLLQFEGIERGANDIADMTDFQELKSEAEEVVEVKLEAGSSPPYSDHDYTFKYKYIDPMKTESGSAWIEEDAPPLGYGPAVKTEEEVERAAVGDLNVVDHVAVDMNVAVDRHMNVNVTSSGQGTKTVILQIPKDIK